MQAEKFNTNLFINLSELEDRELLDAVQIFEKEHFEKKTAKTATILRHLVALEGTIEERIERRDSGTLNEHPFTFRQSAYGSITAFMH